MGASVASGSSTAVFAKTGGSTEHDKIAEKLVLPHSFGFAGC